VRHLAQHVPLPRRQRLTVRTSGGTSYVVTAMAINSDAPFGEKVGLDMLALVRGAFRLVKE
jgi:hypothetical protein